MPENNHETIPVLVWVDVDRGIAGHVGYLNDIPGVRTFASCQGTIGEGGSHPYPAQILASWPPEVESKILQRFTVGERMTGCAYLHPK